jgi:hypothetical protein
MSAVTFRLRLCGRPGDPAALTETGVAAAVALLFHYGDSDGDAGAAG